MRLADRIYEIEESGTVQFTSLLLQLRRAGRAAVDLAVGEAPDDTPAGIIAATRQALEDGQTKYGAVAGLAELKSRLAEQFQGYDEGNILISNGSKQSLYTIFQTLCNPGDEVIILRPYWVSFPEQVKLAGGRPVMVQTRSHQPDIDEIYRAISAKTRAILINSPNNPTGAVYSSAVLEEIVVLALKHNLFIVSDEAYSAYVYDGLQFESVFSFEGIRQQLIVTRSFSKSHQMTGFRVGYVAASKEVIAAINKVQSHLTGNVCTFAQYGALAALDLTAEDLDEYRQDLESKRDYAYRAISAVFGCIKPRGAFYLFPDVSDHLKGAMTSADLARRILKEKGVAVVPGEEFGMAGHVRISYAVSEDQLVSGIERIIEAL
jgi:aspartate aminotransferase